MRAFTTRGAAGSLALAAIGSGGVTLARRIAKAARIKRVRMSRFGSYPGSLGTYAPERYPRSAYVVWELSSRSLTARVRAGLLVAIR